MKTNQSLVKICVLVAALLLPAVVQAQFTYSNNSGGITITGYSGSSTTLTIPDTIDSLPVTSIGDYAFSSTSLISIWIPNSVTNIGSSALSFCKHLNSLWIGDGVIYIGRSAFAGCSSLTYVTIPNNVTSIGDFAFNNCTALNYVSIPNSVTNIGKGAFFSCLSLTSIRIPYGVTSIGMIPFDGCTKLSAITVDALNLNYCSVSGVLFDKNQTTLIEFPPGKTNSSYTVTNSVVSIGTFAFDQCAKLISITIPCGVTNIESYAFFSCSSLTNIYFTGNPPSTGVSVFGNDNNTTVYYLPNITGWSNSFAGRPAVLWNPQAQTSNSSFGIRTNKFGFNITGASNLVVVVEAATNLVNSTWTPVRTNTLKTIVGTNGTAYFSDPQWTNYPGRFYRLRSP